MRIFQYHRTRCNQHIRLDHGVVHHNRAHANQYIIVQNAAMYQRIVSDADIVANDGFRPFVRAMNHRPILNIDPIANPNPIHVGPNDRLKPKTTIIATNYIANNGGLAEI